ncbi:restriction endonuclease subunit S [Spirochaeta dissipatitropha]
MNKLKNSVNSVSSVREKKVEVSHRGHGEHRGGIGEGLPQGWVKTGLLTISSIRTGKYDANHATEEGKYRFYTCAYEYLRCDTKNFSGECLILPGNGANVGEVFFYDGEFDAYQRTYVIENIKIKPKLLYYFFCTNWKEKTTETQYGSATNYIRMGNFEDYSVILPPLNEQKRIVAKLDTIMPHIEAVKVRLDKVPGILKRFRQSVLTAAVSGKLTEQWREEHPEVESAEVLLERIRGLKNFEIKEYPYNLPDEWLVVGFYDVANVKSNLVDPQSFQNHPHIAPDNIERESGKLLSYKTIKEDKVTSPKHLFYNGQIIYSKIRPYLSKAILVNFEGLCSADMYPIESKIDSKYLLYNILGGTFLDFASTAGTRSVLPKINQQELGQIPIPLPPLSEQREIVRQVDKLFSLADKVEAHYQKAKARVDKLSQSVLAKAFRGELVPQDPNDEPAEKLLERIQEEKAKMEAELKGARKRGSKK